LIEDGESVTRFDEMPRKGRGEVKNGDNSDEHRKPCHTSKENVESIRKEPENHKLFEDLVESPKPGVSSMNSEGLALLNSEIGDGSTIAFRFGSEAGAHW
jgi:hypothetical protein